MEQWPQPTSYGSPTELLRISYGNPTEQLAISWLSPGSFLAVPALSVPAYQIELSGIPLNPPCALARTNPPPRLLISRSTALGIALSSAVAGLHPVAVA